MAKSKIKQTRNRGANVARESDGRRFDSADGKRSATARYQKRQLGDRRYDVVECWTLRERDENGRMVIREIQRGEAEAREWCGLADKTLTLTVDQLRVACIALERMASDYRRLARDADHLDLANLHAKEAEALADILRAARKSYPAEL